MASKNIANKTTYLGKNQESTKNGISKNRFG
jgi:hypothetical protein